jgi:hypothetical protein
MPDANDRLQFSLQSNLSPPKAKAASAAGARPPMRMRARPYVAIATACQGCALKSKCTTGKERRISRWEHEAVLEAVQARLDRNPAKMRERAKLWSIPSVQ